MMRRSQELRDEDKAIMDQIAEQGRRMEVLHEGLKSAVRVLKAKAQRNGMLPTAKPVQKDNGN